MSAWLERNEGNGSSSSGGNNNISRMSKNGSSSDDYDYYHHHHPHPRSVLAVLPAPLISAHRRPTVMLADLSPGTYVDTVARVASLKVTEKPDRMGTRLVSSGVLEDRTFKVSYLCYKLSIPLMVNSAFRFKSVYVHGFEEDGSLLLILNEHTRAEAIEINTLKDFFWNPRIAGITRPVYDVKLSGLISSISDASGLIKRCNGCRRAILAEVCPCGCDKGWSWDFRVSARLYDGSGSIRMILTRNVAARIVNKNIGEILFVANGATAMASRDLRPRESGGAGASTTADIFSSHSFVLRLPTEFKVYEALVEDAFSLRKRDALIVPDGSNIAYFAEEHDLDPGGNDDDGGRLSAVKEPPLPKELSTRNPDDRRIIRKLVEKAVDIRIRKTTTNPRLHGTYLLQEPVPLYSCEAAKLYLGFSIRITISEHGEARINATPEACVRESVWDYVKWRRGRGASATVIESSLLRQRPSVLLGTSNHYGHIEQLLFERPGDVRVSASDSRTLVEFWADVHGLQVSPDETPLLKVRPADSENRLTYPPSTVYFGAHALFVSARTQEFISSKRHSLEGRIDSVIRNALHRMSIGTAELVDLESDNIGEAEKDLQRNLLGEIHDRLLGRKVDARGSISSLGDRLYFFPNEIALT